MNRNRRRAAEHEGQNRREATSSTRHKPRRANEGGEEVKGVKGVKKVKKQLKKAKKKLKEINQGLRRPMDFTT